MSNRIKASTGLDGIECYVRQTPFDYVKPYLDDPLYQASASQFHKMARIVDKVRIRRGLRLRDQAEHAGGTVSESNEFDIVPLRQEMTQQEVARMPPCFRNYFSFRPDIEYEFEEFQLTAWAMPAWELALRLVEDFVNPEGLLNVLENPLLYRLLKDEFDGRYIEWLITGEYR